MVRYHIFHCFLSPLLPELNKPNFYHKCASYSLCLVSTNWRKVTLLNYIWLDTKLVPMRTSKIQLQGRKHQEHKVRCYHMFLYEASQSPFYYLPEMGVRWICCKVYAVSDIISIWTKQGNSVFVVQCEMSFLSLLAFTYVNHTIESNIKIII